MITFLKTAKRSDLDAYLTKLRTSSDPINPLISTRTKIEPQIPPAEVGSSVPVHLSLVDELAEVTSQLNVDDDGEMHYYGPTSNLHLTPNVAVASSARGSFSPTESSPPADQIKYSEYMLSSDELESHLLSLYWAYQHPYFYLLSRTLFERDMAAAKADYGNIKYFSPLLYNAMLAHATHISDRPNMKALGDELFLKARRLVEIEAEKPTVTTVQALMLLGSREAGCGRDSGLGWLYSGMSFRMALDLGLHMSCSKLVQSGRMSQDEADVRAITFWSCCIFDRGWSAYLGRPEFIPAYAVRNAPRPTINPKEEFCNWLADAQLQIECAIAQPVHVFTAAQQIKDVTENLGSVIRSLYTATSLGISVDYVTIVTDNQLRLLSWYRELPAHLELPLEDSDHIPLPHVLLMHMMYHTTMILLFRPFISGKLCKHLMETTSPANICRTSANSVVQLLQTYLATHGLRKIANIVVHIAITTSIIHLSNLDPQGVKPHADESWRNLVDCTTFLQEIAQSWPSAYRCLHVINRLMQKYRLVSDDDLQLGEVTKIPESIDTSDFDLKFLDTDNWMNAVAFLDTTLSFPSNF